MNLIKNSDIAIAFSLELFAIFILGYWGLTLQFNKIIRVTDGLLAPVLMTVVWSIWCTPSSSHRLDGLRLVALKCYLWELWHIAHIA
ncbi:YrdB family protein [Enterococcus entomosocium]|uniref:YrdB family protein n=1 Tax=Enterococcus entomosocium TaxID=3034352 RepID=UPI003BD2108B